MNAPRIGLTSWKCWCGLAVIVSADADDDTGWPQVNEHRAEHKRDKKEKKVVTA